MLQESPLFTLDKPILFCLGDSDALCPAAELKATASQLPSPDIRAELFEVGISIAGLQKQTRSPKLGGLKSNVNGKLKTESSFAVCLKAPLALVQDLRGKSKPFRPHEVH